MKVNLSSIPKRITGSYSGVKMVSNSGHEAFLLSSETESNQIKRERIKSSLIGRRFFRMRFLDLINEGLKGEKTAEKAAWLRPMGDREN